MALSGRERTDAFLSSFAAACSRLEGDLAEPSTPVEQLGDQLQTLQKMLTEAASYLPPSLLRRTQQDMKRWRAEVVSRQPKKRFAFTTKNRGATPELPEPCKPVHQVNLPDQAVGLRNRSGETLHLEDVDGKSLELDSLEDCHVTVHGNPAALFATRLCRCELRCGPVTTSAFVEHCEDSKFWLACQQLRVHQSSRCQFWMHVQSRAIVEDSTGLGFGAYDWRYGGQEAHWRASGLDPACNNWRKVDDFNCPMARSPNWTFLRDDSDPVSPVSEQPLEL